MKYLLLFFLLIPQLSYSGELSDVVDEFYEIFPNERRFPVMFQEGDPKFAGRCRHSKGIILINKYWWDYESTKWTRKQIVFHELGHCVLDLRHNRGRSVMNIATYATKKTWPALVADLKRRATTR